MSNKYHRKKIGGRCLKSWVYYERIYSDESDNLYVLTHETKNNKMLLNQYNSKLKLINKLYVPKTIKPNMLKIQKNRIYLVNEIDDNYYLEIYVF